MALALALFYFAWYLKQIKRKWANLLDISCKSRSFSLWVEKYARRFTDYVDQIVPEAMVSVIAQTWNSRFEAEASDALCRRLGFIDYPLSDKESANLALARECGEEP